MMIDNSASDHKLSELQGRLPARTQIRQQILVALAEDVGSGDLTAALLSPAQLSRVEVITRQEAVICGCTWFEEVFLQLDPAVSVEWQVADGERVDGGRTLCRLKGPTRALLTGERTSLNYLQALSGTATRARRYADAVAGLPVRVLDTRKTLPGLRVQQKYAVLCGGCHNHRIGLFDAILIKENHILAAGSIAAALEASGGVSLERIREVAETGVDDISVGDLTKDLESIDLSMRFLDD